MAEEYETVRKGQEQRYQYMMFRLEIAKQQAAEGETCHGFAGVELETAHKEKKTGLKERCQQVWKKVEDEKGIYKKAVRSFKIARNELLVKYKSNKGDAERNFKTHGSTTENENGRSEKFYGDQPNKVHEKPSNRCSDNSNSNLLGPTVFGAGLGAAASTVVGSAAGVLLGSCAIATAGALAGTAVDAAAGTAIGAAAGVAFGGISGAIVALYRCRR